MTEKCNICKEDKTDEFVYILVGDIYKTSYNEMSVIARICVRCALLKGVMRSNE